MRARLHADAWARFDYSMFGFRQIHIQKVMSLIPLYIDQQSSGLHLSRPRLLSFSILNLVSVCPIDHYCLNSNPVSKGMVFASSSLPMTFTSILAKSRPSLSPIKILTWFSSELTFKEIFCNVSA